MTRVSLILVTLFLNFACAEAVDEGRMCFILDGILVIYGIVLTVLYCRLRMYPVFINTDAYPQKPKVVEGIYSGLSHPGLDTYETIKVQKKNIV